MGPVRAVDAVRARGLTRSVAVEAREAPAGLTEFAIAFDDGERVRAVLPRVTALVNTLFAPAAGPGPARIALRLAAPVAVELSGARGVAAAAAAALLLVAV